MGAIWLTGWMAGICLAADPATPTSDSTRPYQMAILLAIEPAPAIPAGSVTDLVHDFRQAIHRTLGDCWASEIQLAPIESLHRLPAPQSVALASKSKVDKILLIRLRFRPDDGRANATVHDFDATLGAWGPTVGDMVRSDRELPLQLVRLCLRAFRPTATIVGKEGRRVKLDIRGSALIPSTSNVALLSDGDPLSIVRIWEEPQPKVEVVPWSFLVVRGTGSKTTRFGGEAEIESVFRDPVTRRSRQKIRLEAVACRVGDTPTTVIEFRTRPEDRPIVGYEAAARPQGQAGFVSLGSTDYSGKVTVSLTEITGRETTRAQVVNVLLLSGDLILARFPVVPGDVPTLLARTSIDPLLPEIAGQVIAFQEGVVDLAARRKILELRLKKASAESNIDRMKQLAESINSLPDREQMTQRLAMLQDAAANRSKELGQKSLGSNLRRLFLQTEALVERSVPQEKYQIQVQAVETPAAPPKTSP